MRLKPVMFVIAVVPSRLVAPRLPRPGARIRRVQRQPPPRLALPQRSVRDLQLRRALLHALFQMVVRLAERRLSASALGDIPDEVENPLATASQTAGTDLDVYFL